MARMAERDSRVTVRKCSPSRSERLRHIRTSTLLVDADRFHTTFLIQHLLGDEGMPRRYADYLPTDGFTATSSPPSEPSFSGYPCCRSPGTCSRAGATASRSTSTARGATATRWNGRAAARRGTQFHRAAPDPVGAARFRAALPAHGGTDARRNPHRAPTPPAEAEPVDHSS
jgi:hypothetical protein